MLIFIIFVINGTSNAVNITDGLDGLATMPVIISCSILTGIAYFSGHIEMSSHLKLFYIIGSGEIAVFLSTIIGSGLAFLWYNCYPAQIFMGDTGSLTLGGIIGVIGVILNLEKLQYFYLLSLVLVLRSFGITAIQHKYLWEIQVLLL